MLHITFELCAGKRENACVPGPKIPVCLRPKTPVCLRPKTPVCLRPKTAYRAAPDTAAAVRNRPLEAHPTRTETLACPAGSNRSAFTADASLLRSSGHPRPLPYIIYNIKRVLRVLRTICGRCVLYNVGAAPKLRFSEFFQNSY